MDETTRAAYIAGKDAYGRGDYTVAEQHLEAVATEEPHFADVFMIITNHMILNPSMISIAMSKPKMA